MCVEQLHSFCTALEVKSEFFGLKHTITWSYKDYVNLCDYAGISSLNLMKKGRLYFKFHYFSYHGLGELHRIFADEVEHCHHVGA